MDPPRSSQTPNAMRRGGYQADDPLVMRQLRGVEQHGSRHHRRTRSHQPTHAHSVHQPSPTARSPRSTALHMAFDPANGRVGLPKQAEPPFVGSPRRHRRRSRRSSRQSRPSLGVDHSPRAPRDPSPLGTPQLAQERISAHGSIRDGGRLGSSEAWSMRSDASSFMDRSPWGTPAPGATRISSRPPQGEAEALSPSHTKNSPRPHHRRDTTPQWPFRESSGAAPHPSPPPRAVRRPASRTSARTRAVRTPDARGHEGGRRQNQSGALHYQHPATPLFSPRIPLPSVLSRVDDLQPMGEATKYLLSQYLAFDELVESTESADVLGGVLENFMEECFSGADEDVRAALTSALGPTVRLPRLTRSTTFPDPLCTAVCCEALEKISVLIDRDWRISRLLHVAKQGIFASIYSNYSPKQWFFRQVPFYHTLGQTQDRCEELAEQLRQVDVPPFEKLRQGAMALGDADLLKALELVFHRISPTTSTMALVSLFEQYGSSEATAHMMASVIEKMSLRSNDCDFVPRLVAMSVSVDAKLSVWKALLDTHNEPGVLERLLQLVVLRLTTTGVTQSLVDNLQAPRSLPTGTSGEAHASDVAREPADQENEVKEHQDVSVAVAARSDTALSEEHEVNHEDLTDSSAQANHMARRQQLQAAETAEQHRNHGQVLKFCSGAVANVVSSHRTDSAVLTEHLSPKLVPALVDSMPKELSETLLLNGNFMDLVLRDPEWIRAFDRAKAAERRRKLREMGEEVMDVSDTESDAEEENQEGSENRDGNIGGVGNGVGNGAKAKVASTNPSTSSCPAVIPVTIGLATPGDADPSFSTFKLPRNCTLGQVHKMTAKRVKKAQAAYRKRNSSTDSKKQVQSVPFAVVTLRGPVALFDLRTLFMGRMGPIATILKSLGLPVPQDVAHSAIHGGRRESSVVVSAAAAATAQRMAEQMMNTPSAAVLGAERAKLEASVRAQTRDSIQDQCAKLAAEMMSVLNNSTQLQVPKHLRRAAKALGKWDGLTEGLRAFFKHGNATALESHLGKLASGGGAAESDDGDDGGSTDPEVDVMDGVGGTDNRMRLTGEGGTLQAFHLKRKKTLARMGRRKFPESFAHLFGKGVSLDAAAPMSLRQLQRVITQLYAEKINYDKAADTTNVSREPFPDYCYSFFLQKYGLKKIAEKHCCTLIKSLRTHRKTTLLVAHAARFAGLVSPLPLDALNMYLDAIQFCNASQTGADIRWESSEEESLVNPHVSLKRAQACAARVLEASASDVGDVQKKLLSWAVQCARNNTLKVAREELLDLILDAYAKRGTRNRKMVEALFLAGDTNMDGILSIDEFSAMVRQLDPMMRQPKIRKMFKQAHSAGGKVTKERFSNVLLRNGLFAYQPQQDWGGQTPSSTRSASADLSSGLGTSESSAPTKDIGAEWAKMTDLDKELGAEDTVLNNPCPRDTDTAFDVLEIAWKSTLPVVTTLLGEVKAGGKRHKNLSHRVAHLEELMEARQDAVAGWMSFQMMHAEVSRMKARRGEPSVASSLWRPGSMRFDSATLLRQPSVRASASPHPTKVNRLAEVAEVTTAITADDEFERPRRTSASSFIVPTSPGQGVSIDDTTDHMDGVSAAVSQASSGEVQGDQVLDAGLLPTVVDAKGD